MKTFPAALILLLAATLAQAAPPVVTNIRAAQLAGTKNVEILYDVSDADGNALTIAVQVSGDAGVSYTIPATALSGHIGAGVAPGVNRRIVWNAGADWNGQLVGSAKVRVTASDGTTPAPPPGMVYIPAGVFQMGDSFYEGNTNEQPLHNVNVSAFFVDRTEVSRELWISVYSWALAHGYNFDNTGLYRASGHPVQTINWYDAVKWCNARAEKEGLVPCYYSDSAQTVVCRGGETDITNAMVKWSANGYRLPIEAEWEKAARGGVQGRRYPWGDTINGSQANFQYSGDPFDSVSYSNPGTTPVGYFNGSQVPSGVDMANGYGLYDMAGDVNEWCWDWYSDSYYSDSQPATDPHGPASSSNGARVVRGGGWNAPPAYIDCARRSWTTPGDSNSALGFRCVRTQ